MMEKIIPPVGFGAPSVRITAPDGKPAPFVVSLVRVPLGMIEDATHVALGKTLVKEGYK